MLWLFGEDRQITEVGAMNVFIFYKNQNGGNLTKITSYNFNPTSITIYYIFTIFLTFIGNIMKSIAYEQKYNIMFL